ncbi:MAG: hypothetical protein Q9168_005537 [Polycauliona sp. 1 TL-2023]
MADTWNEEVAAGENAGWDSAPDSYSEFIPAQLQPAWEENGDTYHTDDDDISNEQDEEQTEVSRRERPLTFTATVKYGLRDRLARLRKHSANENSGDGSGNEATDHAGSSDHRDQTEPTASARFHKLASIFKGLIKGSKSKHAQNTPAGTINNEWAAPADSWSLSTEQREADLRDQAEAKAALEPRNFTDPLEDVEGEDFLSRFLSHPRHLAIHPDRKHKLAAFMLRLCQEAFYEHIKFHAPRALTLLRIKSADHHEFQYWFDIIDGLRKREDIPKGKAVNQDGIRYKHGLQDVRHVTEHRRDYNSFMIQCVVWQLEDLDDQTRRSQLGAALEQMYDDECAASEARIGGVDEDPTADETATLSPTIATFYNSLSSSATLIGSNSNISGQTAVDDDLPATTATPKAPTCIPAIERSALVTTYNQLLRSFQHSLENCLFNHLRDSNPDFLTTTKQFTSSQIELNLYDGLHSAGELKFRNECFSRVADLVYAARKLRNAAAHHSRPAMAECLTDQAERKLEWTARFFQDALELAALASDMDTIRAIKLAAWVADINLSKAAERTREIDRVTPREEWQALYEEARLWKGKESEDGDLYWRLGYCEAHFWGKMNNMEHWYGVRTILARWGQRTEYRLTDPRTAELEEAWNRDHAFTEPLVESNTTEW